MKLEITRGGNFTETIHEYKTRVQALRDGNESASCRVARHSAFHVMRTNNNKLKINNCRLMGHYARGGGGGPGQSNRSLTAPNPPPLFPTLSHISTIYTQPSSLFPSPPSPIPLTNLFLSFLKKTNFKENQILGNLFDGDNKREGES